MANWISGICEANGADIHYLRTGGDKPPLVLLHGLAGSGMCWIPLARALEGEYDIVIPDARGHGESSTPRSGYRYEDHAGDVVGLIHRLGLDGPVLLGHSMGGMTAAVAASQTGASIRGLILADPTFLSPERQREVHESDVAGQHRRLVDSGKHEVAADIRARHPRRSLESAGLLAEARLQTRIEAFEVLRPPTPDYHQVASAIGVRTLLVIADQGVVSAGMARELLEINSRFRLETIMDAGHGFPFDEPDRFEAIVRRFLRLACER